MTTPISIRNPTLGSRRKRASAVAAVLLAAANAVAAQVPVPPAQSLAITDVTVIDVESGRRVLHQTLLVDTGRIIAVGDVGRVTVPARARRIDGRGKFVIPGLIDTHVHLALPADRDSLRTIAALLAHGVTGVREAGAGGQDEWLVALRSRAERGEILSPRIYVSGMIAGRSVTRSGRGSAEALARHLVTLGVDGLKIRDGLTNEDIRAVVAVGRGAGLPVYGHTYDAVTRTRDEIYTFDAIRAGVVGTMHIMGSPQVDARRLPPPPSSPRFGPDWQAWWVYHATFWLHTDPAAERALIDTMVARRAWLEPTLITEDQLVNPATYREIWLREKIPGSFARASEGYPSLSGTSLDQYRASIVRMMDFVRRFHAAGGTVLAGTDCVPRCGYGLHEELRLLVDAGLSPIAALRAATLDAANVLGWHTKVGRVAPGLAADLVLLGDDPLRDIRNVARVDAVITNGRYLDRGILTALLERARVGEPSSP
jgi:imidazolonepropionase-like amidohydrolase